MATQNEFSFARGLEQVPIGKIKKVRKKLMAVLNIESLPGFYFRRDGKVDPTVPEYRAIEKIFAEEGITDVWGASKQCD